MILSFYRSKSHSFQNPEKTGFPVFFCSAARNLGFKILPGIGNTSGTVFTLISSFNDNNNFYFASDTWSISQGVLRLQLPGQLPPETVFLGGSCPGGCSPDNITKILE